GGVDFDDIERSAGGDLLAGLADSARLRRGTCHAVKRLGENARRRGFPDATRSGKDVGMSDAVVEDCVFQRVGNVLLPDQIGKRLRAPLAGDDLIGHWLGLTRRARSAAASMPQEARRRLV